MKKNRGELSFKYVMFWLLWGLLWWIIGQIINKPIDISLILTFSIATFISAPLAYLMVNKSFKEINIMNFCVKVIPLYVLFMILIGVILYIVGFISI